MSYVFGLDPATIAEDYDLVEVISLSQAARRFLERQNILHQVGKYLPQKVPEYHPETTSAEPDRKGFRNMFLSHFKTKLE